ncbi:U32 family peptidase [Deferrisoma camini]|uniref:U32 family peptidase n=1 Tax=Deferrisoma camini TaxID=1035120 RepID=UPI00046D6645|nr:U32 family peptidase [Deferrisoma camini]
MSAILAPVRHPEEVAPLRGAGATEFYCGLTPWFWSRAGGEWVNRRNPESAGLEDEDALHRVVEEAGGLPVYVTLNAPWYPGDAVDGLAAFGAWLLQEQGVSGLIVSDMELLLALADLGLAHRLHLSSVAVCTNPEAVGFFRDLGLRRVILPRHLALDEIGAARVPGVELEVFLLNDGCVFEEGLCATTHRLGPFCLGDGPGTEGVGAEAVDRYEFWKWTRNNCGCRTNRGIPLGPCGLCALPRFLGWGIESLKVVGREASLPRKKGSVRLAARGMEIARSGGGPEEIREAVIGMRGAAGLCEGGRLCYYPEVWRGEPRRAAC